MIRQVFEISQRGTFPDVAGLVADGGTGGCGFATRLAAGGETSVELADAVHFLCLLHGRHPGIMDAAADRVPHDRARDWMNAAAAGFAVERAYLTRLVVAAGPIPSTPRQSQSQAAVTGQASALDVLARSERRGTAFGAALALALDWAAIRPVLDRAARRFDIDPRPLRLPDPRETAAVATIAGETPALTRAIDFGARQLLVQHRGLWDLLEAREAARG